MTKMPKYCELKLGLIFSHVVFLISLFRGRSGWGHVGFLPLGACVTPTQWLRRRLVCLVGSIEENLIRVY